MNPNVTLLGFDTAHVLGVTLRNERDLTNNVSGTSEPNACTNRLGDVLGPPLSTSAQPQAVHGTREARARAASRPWARRARPLNGRR